MTPTRRALLATPLLAAPAHAQAPWPNRGMRMLVGYPAGGANDIVARSIAAPLAEALGQPIVVENRAGAAGSVAAEAVARAAPDGYTLYMISSAQVLAPALRRNLPYDPVRDFTYVAMGARGPYFLVTHPSLPARNVTELVALARQRPGGIAFASSGVGAGPHLTMAMFMHAAGIQFDHVPYRGDADAIVDLTTGRVPVSFISIAAAWPHVQSGALRALAVSSAARLPLAPDVPSVAESGYPGFEMEAWWGLAAPAGLPAPILQRIATAVRPIIDGPVLAERFAPLGFIPGREGPEEFTALVRRDRDRFAEIVRQANITAPE
ncbi:MAG: tripartite tricarboxylate transporter substrate binding protein [Alphaproteobacteria bacterium]|nr:tripartite tricarboxylate transporter substrate binding protein [Alphaproteobacteria bacterium]